MKLRYINIILILLIGSYLYLSSPGSTQSNPPTTLSYIPEQNYVISFIGYEPNLVNLQAVESRLPSSFYNYMNYDIYYDLQIANDSYTTMVNNYVDSIKVNDWTSELNITALENQKNSFGRTDIFNRKNGTSIDARKLEQFIASNPIDTTLPDNNRYFIYVMNFSRFDTSTLDHWLNVTEVDADSGVPRFYWRLEWDYTTNYDVRFPYAAFSETTEIAIIDLTSFQWYLQWRAIWNDNPVVDPSYFNDLDHLIAGKTINEQKTIITDTASVWLSDWINNVFNMEIRPEEIGSTFEVQLQVLYSSLEVNQSEIEWIINNEYIKSVTNNLIQSNSFVMNTKFVDLQSDAYFRGFVQDNVVDYSSIYDTPSPFVNWTYYSGALIWQSIFGDPVLNSRYYDDDAADIVVKGIILLLDNASYVGASWPGGLYTGLGGNRVVTVLFELDRALMPDHQTPKGGLSKILTHEIGHAIGLPHTFDSTINSFTSDFISDAMGYYPGTANFSQIVTKLYQRFATDNKINELTGLYTQSLNKIKDTVLLEVSQIFSELISLHQLKNYIEAYNLAVKSINLLSNPASLISTTSMSISTSNSPTTTSLITTSKDTSSPTSQINSSSISSTSNSKASTNYSLPFLFTLAIIINIVRKNKLH